MNEIVEYDMTDVKNTKHSVEVREALLSDLNEIKETSLTVTDQINQLDKLLKDFTKKYSEDEIIKIMREAGYTYQQIGDIISKSAVTVYNKFNNRGRKKRSNVELQMTVKE